ncbi:MAG TPA: hypothetical protein VGL91_10805 [Acidobacteriota bacterium]
MKAVLEGRPPLEFKEKIDVGYLWILKYEQLFILNNLVHPIILLEKIKKGDEKAFLDFVKVDKSFWQQISLDNSSAARNWQRTQNFSRNYPRVYFLIPESFPLQH